MWEPLEADPTFVIRAMFGTKAVYLGGKLTLCFSARVEPWRGLLVATDEARQAGLRREFPSLRAHPILAKWLYLPETVDDFEPTSVRLVDLVCRRDPRIGVVPSPGKKSRASQTHGLLKRPD